MRDPIHPDGGTEMNYAIRVFGISVDVYRLFFGLVGTPVRAVSSAFWEVVPGGEGRPQ